MPNYRIQFNWEFVVPETNERDSALETKIVWAESKMDAVNEYMAAVHENHHVTWCRFLEIELVQDTPEDIYRVLLEEIKKAEIHPSCEIPYDLWAKLASCADAMFQKLNLQSVDIKA